MSFYDRAKKNFLQYLDPRYMKSIFKNQQENNSSPGFRILTQLLSTVLFGRRCSGGILQPKNLVVVVGPPKGGVATPKAKLLSVRSCEERVMLSSRTVQEFETRMKRKFLFWYYVHFYYQQHRINYVSFSLIKNAVRTNILQFLDAISYICTVYSVWKMQFL